MSDCTSRQLINLYLKMRGIDKLERGNDRRKIVEEKVFTKWIDWIFRPSFRFPRRRAEKAARGLLRRDDYIDVNRRSQMRDDDLVVEIILFVVGFFRMIRFGGCLGSLRILGDRFEPPLLASVQQLDDNVAYGTNDQHRQHHIQLHTGAEMCAICVGDHEAGTLPQPVVRKGCLLVTPK